VLYEHGIGVPKNLPKAVRWYRLASEQDLADAQYKLGRMLSKGVGIPKNDKEALGWYTKGAQSGLIIAQVTLGMV
jgi:TPR repeat protein